MSTDTAPIHTIEVGFPWSRPPVARVYLTPRARVRRVRNRFLASAFVADLSRGWARSLAILGGFAALFVGLLVFRGLIVAADIAGLMAR